MESRWFKEKMIISSSLLDLEIKVEDISGTYAD